MIATMFARLRDAWWVLRGYELDYGTELNEAWEDAASVVSGDAQEEVDRAGFLRTVPCSYDPHSGAAVQGMTDGTVLLAIAYEGVAYTVQLDNANARELAQYLDMAADEARGAYQVPDTIPDEWESES
jgi:hypothetical protein